MAPLTVMVDAVAEFRITLPSVPGMVRSPIRRAFLALMPPREPSVEMSPSETVDFPLVITFSMLAPVPPVMEMFPTATLVPLTTSPGSVGG